MFTDKHGLAPGQPDQRCIRATLDGAVVGSVTASADFCESAAPSVVTATADMSVPQARDDSTAWNLTSICVWA